MTNISLLMREGVQPQKSGTGPPLSQKITSPFVLRESKIDSAQGANMERSFQHAIFLRHSMMREI